jgi:hypothetical protein
MTPLGPQPRPDCGRWKFAGGQVPGDGGTGDHPRNNFVILVFVFQAGPTNCFPGLFGVMGCVVMLFKIGDASARPLSKRWID